MAGKTAMIFPGQGSQYVGMGQDFVTAHPWAGEIMERTEEISGIPVKRLCLEGPMESLTATVNLQPCLTAVEIICAKAIGEAGVTIDAVAGHSLGEYPALWAAGVLELDHAVELVIQRARLMEKAASERPGSMAAILGLSREELQAMVDSAHGEVALANHNSQQQIVVTGEKEGVAQVCHAAKEAGAKAIPLKVAGAFHSPLMKEAAKEFGAYLEKTPFKDPLLPFYSNVTAGAESSGDRIRGLMERQLCEPVRWYDIIGNMAADGIETFIEAGPKKVLSNLIKKILPGARVFQVDDQAALEACAKQIQK